ncbi:uncharacterized protein LACBIDRAFT_299442 [Laccaria bicolor S238N-H82]|uniref:Predicted protein n=1 Tax=Laccaria bicolor (strain S238N-H82 / ATCC MYA-4686) TaxID=486041 RepID=B0DEQ5_LACBS|nr:uncharacterized protein LACBIDRAFT_299442 [Laccaria bicolor S238N-H82]EDR07069.1 predicted protein [Laccaria bicolor S238N-H82]|eukprot:XP_001882442.1 predicted protein [Laccaria bicolor S238N-H82]
MAFLAWPFLHIDPSLYVHASALASFLSRTRTRALHSPYLSASFPSRTRTRALHSPYLLVPVPLIAYRMCNLNHN